MARYRRASPDRAWTRDAMRGDVGDDANAHAKTMCDDAREFERADVRDNADLLRERSAAHWTRVHVDSRGRIREVPTIERRRRVLSHWYG
jgi:hypothetical protein